jgi:hypothetical protein
MTKVRTTLLMLAIALAMGASPAIAQPVPPTPTAGFCVNKLTGAIRMQLMRPNGFTAPCPTTALSIDLASLQALPVQPPPSGAMVTRPVAESQVAFVAPTAPPEVVDSNGKSVGQLVGFDYQGDGYAAMSVAGQGLAVPVSGEGFTQENSFPGEEGPKTVSSYYTSNDCTGSPWFAVIISPQSLLELVSIGAGSVLGPFNPPSPTIIGDTLFYAPGPFSNPSLQTGITFTNPTLDQILTGQGTCSPGLANFLPSNFVAGTPPAEGSLAGYAAPFSIKR